MASTPHLDLGKLRALVRRQSDEQLFYMLDDALERLPPDVVLEIVGQYIDAGQLERVLGPAVSRSLLDEVKDFDRASRGREYYESFVVNSKNCTETSTGTRAFIADCRRLFDRCTKAGGDASPAEICAALDLLIDLVRDIDNGVDELLFADEGGSWMFGIDWRRVFPVWFRCLAQTTAPTVFAARVVEVVDAFEHSDRDKYFRDAAESCGADHRAALETHKARASSKTRR